MQFWNNIEVNKLQNLVFCIEYTEIITSFILFVTKTVNIFLRVEFTNENIKY